MPESNIAPVNVTLFGESRQAMLDISGHLNNLCDDLLDYLAIPAVDGLHHTDVLLKHGEAFKGQIRAITEAAERDLMKVVVVGHTSAGKSTFINAVLRDAVLPTGMGHTTNCMCILQGTPEELPYIVREEPIGSKENTHDDMKATKRLSADYMKSLAHALRPEGQVNANGVISLHWPTNRCKVLAEPLQIIDSPGIDVSTDMNEFIDRYCMDADVFILIANAESTIKMGEKHFFEKVSEKISKPNVFIIQNRWDLADQQGEDAEEVRKQHLESSRKFLVDELQVVREEQLNQRVWFLSCREMLKATQVGGLQELMDNLSTNGLNNSANAKAVQERFNDFKSFEHELQTCVTHGAIKTKFQNHVNRGLHIAYTMTEDFDEMLSAAETLRKEIDADGAKVRNRVFRLRNNLARADSFIHGVIEDTCARIRSDVMTVLEEDIAFRLEVVINQYDYCRFSMSTLPNYKRMLGQHMSTHFQHEVEERCRYRCQQLIEEAQTSVLDEIVRSALEDNREDMEREKMWLNSLMRPDVIVVSMDCNHIVSEFHEDLTFRFFLSPENILITVLGGRMARSLGIVDNSKSLNGVAARKASGDMTNGHPVSAARETEVSVSLWRFIMNQIMKPSSVLLTAVVSAVITKPQFWSGVVIMGATYGGIYALEYCRYNNRAKEKRFKEQFAAHSKLMLSDSVRHIASGIESSVRREMKHSFGIMSQHLDAREQELSQELSAMDAECQGLAVVLKDGSSLRKRCIHLRVMLTEYHEAYIDSHPQAA
eukprot:Clim_evm37s197 gene=Clim_evmTU37s197